MDDLIIDLRGAIDDAIDAGEVDPDNYPHLEAVARELARMIAGPDLADYVLEELWRERERAA